ncbi:tetratricopeptide-like helical domain-containing protein [Artemisia annua]|uniref:Tetratricopeptide-like helical domain-containing protein n=1 Tax=Artemisia annua TaxID=35608 RepID=A0A2U1KN89_ARTAN|nr:tetratricopeptide-like helical domain-containing protein [Artemisia annua]
MAYDMPGDVSQPVVSDGGVTHAHNVSAYDGDFDGPSVQRHRLNDARHVASLSGGLAGGSESSRLNAPLIDALPAVPPALHVISGAQEGSSLPVQPITVDGLESAFMVGTIQHQPFRAHTDAACLQGSSGVPAPFSVGGPSNGVPVILDFTSGQIGCNQVPAGRFDNVSGSLPRATPRGPRRSRARGARAPSNQQDSHNGSYYAIYKLFSVFREERLKPNVKTYTVMVIVHCQQGLFGKAKDLLTKMEENGCLADSVIYNVIVRELLKKNECKEAENHLEEMIDRGFLPDASTIAMLLPLIPSGGQDSRIRTIIQKIT